MKIQTFSLLGRARSAEELQWPERGESSNQNLPIVSTLFLSENVALYSTWNDKQNTTNPT